MIVNQVVAWARTQPHKAAIVRDDVPFSYAAFARAIGATRTFLAERGVVPHQTVVVLAGDLRDCWVMVLAIQAAGSNALCVQTLEQVAALEIRDLLCVVTTAEDQLQHDLGVHSWPLAPIIVVPRIRLDGTPDGPLPDPVPGRPGGQILYTSGSTGRYKKLLADHDGRALAMARAKGFATRTLFHAAGFGLWTAAGYINARAVWHCGGSVVLDQRPDFLTRLFSHPITDLFLLAADFKELLALRAASEAPVEGVRLTTAGSFLPLATAVAAVRRVSDHLVIGYGSTECFPVLQQRFITVDDLLWLSPFEDRTVEIVDDEDRLCAIGQEGQVRIRLAEYDCTSYLHDGEASARAFRDGCFYPGDRGMRRSDGRIRILGRVEDVLNFQGQKVAVAPIEQDLQERLQVADVCLFCTLADDGKERLTVAIRSPEQPPRSTLDAIARTFAGFEEVRFVVLQEFPRTGTGMKKVDRVALRGQVTNRGT